MSEAQVETEPCAAPEAEPAEPVMVTDVFINGVGMLQLVGSRDAMYHRLMDPTTKLDVSPELAFMPDGDHIDVSIYTEHVSLIAREHEEPIVTPDKVKAAIAKAVHGQGKGKVLEVGGHC